MTVKIPSLVILAVFAWLATASFAMSQSGYVTRVWTIPDNYYLGTPESFPERRSISRSPSQALGVALSGGGTRAAAAAIGDLRALRDAGWLSRVGYLSAVSGGSWAAVPFVFSDGGGDARLLGRQPDFDELTAASLTRTPDGSLAQAVSHAGLLTCATAEIGARIVTLSIDDRRAIGRLATRCQMPSTDADTYSRLLYSIFLRTTTRMDVNAPMAFDDEQVAESIAVNPTLTATSFARPSSGRPFLIVNAVVIRDGADGIDLQPIEMTPFYTGSRRYHASVGGSYIWSWAFGAGDAVAAYNGAQFVRVMPAQTRRGLTAADMMAASGAAPLLEILARSPAQVSDELLAFFPHFRHFAVRDERILSPERPVLHGDGGFLDNIGIMPLLARKVKNIIVFINSRDSLASNDDLKSYFNEVSTRADNGKRDRNVVFDAYHYTDVIDGFMRSARHGRGVVYCGSHWRVLANATYNIGGYDDVNVCFVYNAASMGWWSRLPTSLQAAIPPPRESVLAGYEDPAVGRGEFDAFPWYATFFQNSPAVIQLTAAQVDVLAHMACWTVLDRRRYIEQHLAGIAADGRPRVVMSDGRDQ